jgi:hypothetical protein
VSSAEGSSSARHSDWQDLLKMRGQNGAVASKVAWRPEANVAVQDAKDSGAEVEGKSGADAAGCGSQDTGRHAGAMEHAGRNSGQYEEDGCG